MSITFSVLYSSRQRAWKIADFGLTVEGTSKHKSTTRYARGTSSYRAPELIRDFSFTNKVDIWALGCILYEVVFLQKAFLTDNAVHDYALKSQSTGHRLKLPLERGVSLDETFQTSITPLLYSMLEIEPANRPSATDLLQSFAQAFGEQKTEPWDAGCPNGGLL